MARRASSRVYVELIRNTPFIVQLFFIFFGLPAAGVKLSEIAGRVPRHDDQSRRLFDRDHPRRHRGGAEGPYRGRRQPRDDRGSQVLRYVVLKQAFQKIYPALSSQIIIVMLGSAVVSQISAEDLTYAANFIQSRNFRAFEVYLVVALLYLLLAIVARALLARARPCHVSEGLSHVRFQLLGHPVEPPAGRRAGPIVLSLIAFVSGGIVGLAAAVRCAPRASSRWNGSPRSTSSSSRARRC